MTNKISIIVPIYNAEKYIKKCIDSIIQQTYTNIEVILVNDGSTDNSQKICEEYAKKDNRIIVINKENGGPGAAKNAGINNSTGDYIGFVDSDDYIEKDMYEVLYNLCTENNAQISMIDFTKIINGKPINVPNLTNEIIIYDRLKAIQELLLDKEIKNYSWNKLFKREVFESVRFSENTYYEDIDITIKLFENAEKIIHKKTSKYNYVQRSGSIVNSKSYEKLKDFLIVTKNRYDYVSKKYKEIDIYNAIGFVANMVIVYKNAVIYDIDKLYKDFINNYELFNTLVNEYKTEIFCKLSNYRRLVLSIILWDKDLGKNIVKEIERQIENNV